MLILDTETTGLDDDDVILEIGICDTDYNVLFNKRIRPARKRSWAGAERIHHISFNDVRNCPKFPEILDELKSILEGQRVCIFNRSYDIGLLRQTCESHGIDAAWVRDIDSFCCMLAAGRAWPEDANYYGGMKLSCAEWLAREEKLIPKPDNPFPPHSAIGDCVSTAFVINTINAMEGRSHG